VKRFIATHYYFENQGSATTLTKAENLEYTRSVRAFLLAQAASGPSEGIEVNRWKKITRPQRHRIFFYCRLTSGICKAGLQQVGRLLQDSQFPADPFAAAGTDSPENIHTRSRSRRDRYQVYL